MTLDPITIEVIANRLIEIVTTMQYIIFRTGYSTIIRESMDTSAAIADAQGRLVGQTTQMPMHLGVFTPTVDAILRRYPLSTIRPGDSFVVNNPYEGGSPHAPDFIVATPAFDGEKLIAFCLSIAHKPDIGGMVPGSSSGTATEIFQEGILFPPVRYYRAGELNEEVEAILRNNSRVPDLIVGDLRGQVGCTRVGVQRVQELCAEYGVEVLEEAFEEVLRRTNARLRQELRAWPDGVQEAEGFVDDDGIEVGKPVRLHVRVIKEGEKVTFDFSESSDQTRGPLNIRPPLVRSGCHWGLVGMIDPTIPNNHGVTELVQVICREGSVVNPRFPAPVNKYTSITQLVFTCILKALGQFMPHKAIGAASTGGSIAVGGNLTRTGQSYVQYEIFAGSSGGRTYGDGASGLSTDFGNCKITQIEILETEFPVRLRRFELAPDTAGAGKYRGGLGLVREYEFLQDSTLTLRSGSQRLFRKWGVYGGKPGSPGRCTLNPGRPEEQELPLMTGGMRLSARTSLRLEFSGAGGYGNPYEREPQLVLRDVLDGYVSVERAREEYGVVINPNRLEVDVEATRSLRSSFATSRA